MIWTINLIEPPKQERQQRAWTYRGGSTPTFAMHDVGQNEFEICERCGAAYIAEHQCKSASGE